LVVVHLGSVRTVHEPPGGSTDSGGTHVSTDSHVTEEQPAGDQRLVAAPGGLVHDVEIRWVETEGGGGETVSHQVDPQKLDGDKSFRKTKGSGKENTVNKRQSLRQTSTNHTLLSPILLRNDVSNGGITFLLFIILPESVNKFANHRSGNVIDVKE